MSRSPFPQTEADLDKLSLKQIDAEIARTEQRMALAATKYLVKSGFSRLLWLDRYRSRRFDLPAPDRQMRARY